MVYLVLDTPTLSVSPASSFVQGEHLSLKCIVKGTTPIVYKWFHNDKTLTGNSNELVFLNSTLKHTTNFTKYF